MAVCCRSGVRIRNAAETLIDNSFTMVYDIGGIGAWIDKDCPVVGEE